MSSIETTNNLTALRAVITDMEKCTRRAFSDVYVTALQEMSNNNGNNEQSIDLLATGQVGIQYQNIRPILLAILGEAQVERVNQRLN